MNAAIISRVVIYHILVSCEPLIILKLKRQASRAAVRIRIFDSEYSSSLMQRREETKAVGESKKDNTGSGRRAKFSLS